MPVTISILDLLEYPKTEALLPTEFTAFLPACEEAALDVSEERNWTSFGAAADWLDEHDEPDLARAFRYIFRRPKIRFEKHSYGWSIVGANLPYRPGSETGHDDTLVATVAQLARHVKALRAELE